MLSDWTRNGIGFSNSFVVLWGRDWRSHDSLSVLHLLCLSFKRYGYGIDVNPGSDSASWPFCEFGRWIVTAPFSRCFDGGVTQGLL